MRPCGRCGQPIENNATACPGCGHTQVSAPKANPAPEPQRPGFARRVLTDVLATGGLLSCLPFVAFVVLGVAVGSAAGGVAGGFLGGIAAIGLVILVHAPGGS